MAFVKDAEDVFKLRLWGDKGILLKTHHSDKLAYVNDTVVININFGYHNLWKDDGEIMVKIWWNNDKIIDYDELIKWQLFKLVYFYFCCFTNKSLDLNLKCYLDFFWTWFQTNAV